MQHDRSERRRAVWARRAGVVFLLAFGLLAAPGFARADEQPPAVPVASAIDELGLLARIQDELSRFVQPPANPGHDGALTAVWKVHVQKRAKRAQQFVRDLQKPARWQLVAPDATAQMLVPDAWRPFVQRLAKAYSELAAARGGMSKIKLSPRPAIRRWQLRHPEPDLRRRTAAERALDSLRGTIAFYLRQGRVVPYWMYARESVLTEDALRERRLLEEAHRQWGIDREAAIQQIQLAVAQTRNAAQIEGERLGLFLANFSALVRVLALKEEARLLRVAERLGSDPSVRKAAEKDFKAMAAGRAALEKDEAVKSSKWSSHVRQGWMRPRSHLISVLKRASAKAPKE